MNNKISQVLAYILSHYKEKPISVPRLVRIFFLSEWYAAIVKKETMSSAKWYRRNFGPLSDDIIEKLIDPNIIIEKNDTNADGMTITVSNNNQSLDYSQLGHDDISILNLAMKHAQELDFISLDRYIENLFPMKNTAINAEINILELAKKAP